MHVLVCVCVHTPSAAWSCQCAVVSTLLSRFDGERAVVVRCDVWVFISVGFFFPCVCAALCVVRCARLVGGRLMRLGLNGGVHGIGTPSTHNTWDCRHTLHGIHSRTDAEQNVDDICRFISRSHHPPAHTFSPLRGFARGRAGSACTRNRVPTRGGQNNRTQKGAVWKHKHKASGVRVQQTRPPHRTTDKSTDTHHTTDNTTDHTTDHTTLLNMTTAHWQFRRHPAHPLRWWTPRPLESRRRMPLRVPRRCQVGHGGGHALHGRTLHGTRSTWVW